MKRDDDPSLTLIIWGLTAFVVVLVGMGLKWCIHDRHQHRPPRIIELPEQTIEFEVAP